MPAARANGGVDAMFDQAEVLNVGGERWRIRGCDRRFRST